MVTSRATREELQRLDAAAWPAYLLAHSGLPGPRANLTLVVEAAGLADENVTRELLRDGGEYAMMCAAAALARRADNPAKEEAARGLAVDERWRVREGVAIGLQLLGDASPAAMRVVVENWVDDPHPLVQRAAVAAICEPRLLKLEATAVFAIEVCRRCTANLVALPPDRRARTDARALRQALGYCWSVAVAAAPEPGLLAFRQLSSDDPDVAWIVKENVRKKRLSALL